MTNFNYFSKYEKEDLNDILDNLIEFQTYQSLGLFLTKATWLVLLISSMWNASMTLINKIVFGILFLEFPFAVYLFRELNFNIGFKYTSVIIGMSVFVFIMNGLYNIVDDVANDVAEAIDMKDNNKEDDSDE